MPMSDLAAEYRSLRTEIDEAVGRVLASGDYVLGDELKAFEEAFAEYVGARYAERPRPSRYAPEVRERAVRMVFAHQGEHRSQWAAICSIAEKFGCSPETLRKWVRQSERDAGVRSGLTTDQLEELKTPVA